MAAANSGITIAMTLSTIRDMVTTPLVVDPAISAIARSGCANEPIMPAALDSGTANRYLAATLTAGAPMPVELHPVEARVIGCLIEKQIATPDQYPLSLNALVNACNQKSNREPVLTLDEREVQAAIDGLARRQLVLEKSGFGSRVPKYQHLFCNTEFGSLKFSPQQTAIVCELLLRGPQTPGELRTHAARLAPLRDVSEVETALEDLMTRPDGPFVLKLPREPGRRESRYVHLFSGEPPPLVAEGARMPESPAPQESSAVLDRIAALEAAVAELCQEVDRLRAR
jgi:hypothetical protein